MYTTDKHRKDQVRHLLIEQTWHDNEIFKMPNTAFKLFLQTHNRRILEFSLKNRDLLFSSSEKLNIDFW